MKIGDRVEYSDEGIKCLNPRVKSKKGTLVGCGHDWQCARVLWDNYHSIQTIHFSFIQLSPQPAEESDKK